MNRLRSQNPFVLGLLTVSVLGLLSWLQPAHAPTVAGVPLRPVRLLADVLRPPVQPVGRTHGLALPPPNGTPAPPRPPAADTLPGRRAVLAAAVPSPAAAAAPTAPAVANVPGLSHFVAALRQAQARGGKVRVAYFGDSMIEGDLLTGDLRNLLQADFGGAGVGFVPINSLTADFRETIRQTFSADWYEYNLMSDHLPATCPLGVSGHAFLPRVVSNADSTGIVADTSWVAFRPGQRFGPTRRFAQARLFYGPGSRRDQVLVTTDGHRETRPLNGAEALNELALPFPRGGRALRLAFATHGPRPVYGVSFEGAQGITLDNFSFRSNSGVLLQRLPAAQLAAFGRALRYQLIILHYGVNVPRDRTYASYEQAMARVVGQMKQAFPEASILLVGMSDKSTRLDGEFVTDPQVPLLLAAQQRVALRTHVAFWNLFAAMGGENTMTRWVEQAPPLAHNDYTHVNALGGRRMAELLHAYLLSEYQRAGKTGATEPAAATAAAR
ncbi:SGNH/GDSL hydrolase family protein [Hymenobacter ruricola]|uniref:SGNH hydrolase-type esterase domain-containing protein n=1 Tax=Hymenobacter ruricola TaxID=2791023 RepID=A0ABS0I5H7_9BACT|nr:hypothetical protein [Hymenobacter ruricola]MBF9222036.1 hypothetical protein [Hymenobacter ruricola]